MSSRLPYAPLAACGALLAVLALAVLSRPRDAHGGSPPRPTGVDASFPDAGAAALDSEARRRLLRAQPLDLNRASASDLELLPRIGPALAERIVESREREGAFEAVEELTRVRGIGPRTLEEVRSLVVVDTDPSPPSGAAPLAP